MARCDVPTEARYRTPLSNHIQKLAGSTLSAVRLCSRGRLGPLGKSKAGFGTTSVFASPCRSRDMRHGRRHGCRCDSNAAKRSCYVQTALSRRRAAQVPLYERWGERSALRNTREARARWAPTGCRDLFCHLSCVTLLLSCEAIRGGSLRLSRSLVASGFELPFCNSDGRWQVHTTPARRQHSPTRRQHAIKSSFRSHRCDLAARAKECLQIVLVPMASCAYEPTP